MLMLLLTPAAVPATLFAPEDVKVMTFNKMTGATVTLEDSTITQILQMLRILGQCSPSRFLMMVSRLLRT